MSQRDAIYVKKNKEAFLLLYFLVPKTTPSGNLAIAVCFGARIVSIGRSRCCKNCFRLNNHLGSKRRQISFLHKNPFFKNFCISKNQPITQHFCLFLSYRKETATPLRGHCVAGSVQRIAIDYDIEFLVIGCIV